jgi:putative FmdB family regulatory protein
MPIYEYRCGHCGKASSFFTRAIIQPLQPECRHCRSRDMHRRISSVAVGKTARSARGKYPSSSGVLPSDYSSDPRNIGRRVEDSFARYGMEMPKSVRETIGAAREGDLPKGLEE